VSDEPQPQGTNAAAFTRLHRALEDQDLDAVVALLDPEVEVVGLKGTFHGREEVRRWATKSDRGYLYSRVEVDEVREVGPEHVAVAARRLWYWRHGDRLGDEAGFGAVFRFRDGRVLSWRQDFPSIIEALDAIPARAHD
jgi:ketosteroid isomerase-like protein